MKKEENEEKDKLFLGMISVLQQGVPSFNFFSPLRCCYCVVEKNLKRIMNLLKKKKFSGYM